MTETYGSVFSTKKLRTDDYERLAFLQEVAEGSVIRETRDGNVMLSIETALEAEDPTSGLAKKLRAANVMRQWYLHPNKVSRSDIEENIADAEIKYLLFCIPECLEVLRKHRLRELRAAFNEAFNTREDIREQAIYAAAETLLNSGHKELVNYAITKMAEWQRTVSASQLESRAA